MSSNRPTFRSWSASFERRRGFGCPPNKDSQAAFSHGVSSPLRQSTNLPVRHAGRQQLQSSNPWTFSRSGATYVMRKVIVLGGSAGGIEAFSALLKELPVDIAAPVLAVIHIGEGGNMLVEVLQRCTSLKVLTPNEPEPLEEGRVYLGPPNRHLTVRDGCVLAAHGP